MCKPQANEPDLKQITDNHVYSTSLARIHKHIPNRPVS